jgi:ABC-type lipoprotein release transport system permease subunit
VLAAVAVGAGLAGVLSPGVRGAVGRLMPVTLPSIPGLLAGIGVVVLGFALLTAVMAGRRISRIDPQEALRDG